MRIFFIDLWCECGPHRIYRITAPEIYGIFYNANQHTVKIEITKNSYNTSPKFGPKMAKIVLVDRLRMFAYFCVFLRIFVRSAYFFTTQGALVRTTNLWKYYLHRFNPWY